MKAKDIMTTPVIQVTPAASLKELAGLLVDNDISAVPVVDDMGDLVGIVTEADVVPLQADPDPRRHLIPMARREGPIPETAGQVMTREVITVTPDADVTDIVRLMLERRIKRVPVVEGSRVVGMLSRRDVLKVLARSDASIEAELQDRLDDEVMLLGRFTAAVADGIVTLTGPDDVSARKLVELLARSTPGVVAVRFADPSP